MSEGSPNLFSFYVHVFDNILYQNIMIFQGLFIISSPSPGDGAKKIIYNKKMSMSTYQSINKFNEICNVHYSTVKYTSWMVPASDFDSDFTKRNDSNARNELHVDIGLSQCMYAGQFPC